MVWILWYIFWSLPSFPSELLNFFPSEPLALWILHDLAPGCSSFPNSSQTPMLIQPHQHSCRSSNMSSHSYLRIFPLLLFFQECSSHRRWFVWLMSSTSSNVLTVLWLVWLRPHSSWRPLPLSVALSVDVCRHLFICLLSALPFSPTRLSGTSLSCSFPISSLEPQQCPYGHCYKLL